MTLECETKTGWVQFIEFIESRCSSAEFENWIAPIRCLECAHEETVLEVPNIFVQGYLLDNFKEALSDFLPLKSSGDPAIRFMIAEETLRGPPPVAETTTPPE